MKPGWRLAAASSIGTSHVSSGLPCQDSSAHAVIQAAEGEVLVVVVTDGAGSAAHSDVGSWLAAKTLVECLEVYLDDGGSISMLTRQAAVGWIEEVAAVLQATAQANQHAVRDYACTLLAAIVGLEDAAFLQVGDGAIVVSHGEEDGWSYVFWPQHGEFANTTNFVVSANVADILEFEVAPRSIDEFAVFSDGIEKLVLHDATKSVHGAFFDKMFPPIRRAEEAGCDRTLSDGLRSYLGSPVICERTDDDKTLVLASRASPVVP